MLVRTHSVDFHHPLNSQFEEHWPGGSAWAESEFAGWVWWEFWSAYSQGLKKHLEFALTLGAWEQCSRSLTASGSHCPDSQDMMWYPRRGALCSGFNWFSWCGRKSCRTVQTRAIAAEETLGSLTVLVIKFHEWRENIGVGQGQRQQDFKNNTD